MRAWIVVGVLSFTACGRDSSAMPDAAVIADSAVADTPADAATCAQNLLFASEPYALNAGDQMMLEGAFLQDATFDLPGAPGLSAAALGANRAALVIPSTATSGLASVVCGSPSPLPFHRVTFAQGLGPFVNRFEQSAGAVADHAFVHPRAAATATVIERTLYVIGGDSERGLEKSIERATINADGAIGAFSVVTGSELVIARVWHTSTRIGPWLYVVGGSVGNGLFLDSVERAQIMADGSLGQFVTLPSSRLTRGRSQHTAHVIGDYLYVFGGVGPAARPPWPPLDTIERAKINADGSLGNFVKVTNVALATARLAHASVVFGDYIYVIGGGNNGTIGLGDVERAKIDPDGTLGPFAALPQTLQTYRGGHAVAIIGRGLYVIGGIGGPDSASAPLTSIERATIRDDGSLDPFVTLADSHLTIPRTVFASVQLGNFIYFFGGHHEGHLFAQTWERASINGSGSLGMFATSSTMLSTARAGHSTVVVAAQLYAIGGYDGSQVLASIDAAVVHPDGTLGSPVLAATSLLIPRAYHATAIASNFLFVIGGRDSNGATLAGVERSAMGADGTLGTFTDTTRTLVTPRQRHGAAIVGNALYVIGGRDTNGNLLATIERATLGVNGTLGTFAVVATLATPRADHAIAVLGNSVYVIGGTTATGAVTDIEAATIEPDESLSAFAPVANLATARAGHAALVIGNRLYVIGGAASVERASINANGAPGAFAIVPGLTTTRVHATVASAGNYVYVVGGTSGGVALASIERSPLQ